MAIIKCKMCGGDMELTTDKTFGTCEYCGSTMTLPKIDDDQRAAAFNRGNHFRRIGEFDKALAVYENIVRENDSDAEAHWCCALCRFGIEYVEDPATYEWLPTCHRASFDSFLEDVDYLAAVEHSDGITKRQYQKDAAKIAEVQKGILATSQNEEPFDVFICYKESDENGNRTVDSTLAQDIYYQLTEQGYRTFFARITLEDVVGTQYEPYIFAALNSAKVMVALGTRAEHFNAVWVKNEWSRFLAMMRKDRSKLLLPCYRDMDPYDMPEQLGVLQSYDMSKIGFVQDLLRGISKVLDAGKKQEVKETVVVQQASAPSNNVTPLLKRGNMALEDGDWAKADEFFEEVLNQDAECAEAYLGKMLAAEKAATLDKLAATHMAATQYGKYVTINLPTMDQHINAIAQKCVVPNYLELADILKHHYNPAWKPDYKSAISDREAQLAAEQKFWAENKHYLRAVKFASDDFAKRMNAARDQVLAVMETRLAQAKKEAEEAKATAEKSYEEYIERADAAARWDYEVATAKREEDYQSLCRVMDTAQTAKDLRKIQEKSAKLIGYQDSGEKLARLAELIKKADIYQRWYESINSDTLDVLSNASRAFEELGDYKDSAQLAIQCKEKAETLVEEQKRREIAEARQRAKRKKRNTIITVIILLLAGAAAAFYFVGLPELNYRKAERFLSAGQYDKAIAAFEELENYKYVPSRIPAVKYRKAEALLAAEQYDEAAAAFAELEVYEDAPSRTLEAKYRKAEAFLASENYGKAAILFGQVSWYQDAKARSMKLWDQIAYRETISAGYDFTVGLRADGTVVAVGRNNDGQCNVSDWTDIVAVSAGEEHTVGLKADGTVVAVGRNNDGQCNVSDWTDIVAISAGDDFTVGLKADGTIVAVGGYPRYLEGSWPDVVAVSARAGQMVGLKAGGTVVADGNNRYGQINVSAWTDIVSIDAGETHTVGLKTDGTVVVVGRNLYGLYDVSNWSDIVAVSAGAFHTFGLKADGTVVAAGNNQSDQYHAVDWTDIVSISAGETHTAGLKTDGTVVAVGSNIHGQCDVSGWTNIKVPQ